MINTYEEKVPIVFEPYVLVGSDSNDITASVSSSTSCCEKSSSRNDGISNTFSARRWGSGEPEWMKIDFRLVSLMAASSNPPSVVIVAQAAYFEQVSRILPDLCQAELSIGVPAILGKE